MITSTKSAKKPLYSANGDMRNGSAGQKSSIKRPRSSGGSSVTGAQEKQTHEERRIAVARDLYARSDRIIARLFQQTRPSGNARPAHANGAAVSPDRSAKDTLAIRPTRSGRPIDEDDYGDDDDDDDDENDDDGDDQGQEGEDNEDMSRQDVLVDQSLQSRRGLERHLHEGLNGQSPAPNFDSKRRNLSRADNHVNRLIPAIASNISDSHDAKSTTNEAESSEDVRKRLEREKKAAEDAAQWSFQAMFYTLENDRDAMLEQQKLEELDRQVASEMSNAAAHSQSSEAQGTLSTTNLGASSLTLKHLFARIDANRKLVKANDAQLRSLISEVRKNRSKWASEERVGQEELYEAAERVLMELKSMTEYAAPFLTKVKRADAPDYHRIIKEPMDLGTMLKKLSKAQYDSKKEFCDDLSLIWTNCLTYNTTPEHPFRKKAIHMQKETARLIPLIPDIVIRDRKDVEREEQQLEQLDDAPGSESDEDDRPIAATRGRKAPSKSSKGGLAGRKASDAPEDGSTDVGGPAKPSIQAFTNVKSDRLKADVDSVEGSQHGLSTPPPGSGTPSLPNGQQISVVPHGEETDALQASVLSNTLVEDPEEEDEEYRIWKRVTKKDRARVAAERHRLFRGDKLAVEEPAILRTRGAMRRWVRQQSKISHHVSGKNDESESPEGNDEDVTQGTLTDDISRESESTLPDYYDPVAGLPYLTKALHWVTDVDGNAVDQREDCLRLLPSGAFTSPSSELASRIAKNMRQMQETRKVAAKIGIVKQMQVQTQTYQNQFQKYAPEPFYEADAGPIVMSDEGPFISTTLVRAALQRSVGELFYSAGFEDFQPSALEAATDIAGDYFVKMLRTFKLYIELPRGAKLVEQSSMDEHMSNVPRFHPEAAVLHTLFQNGLELNDIESYVQESCNTLPGKLETHHARMRDYYAELLRPALDPSSVGTDGAGAFADGNETQFVAGDFAEDIDEDFFGFKELGLDREFGLASMSVPLHLLQSRMSNLYQPSDAAAAASSGNIMDTPAPYPALTAETLQGEIALVHDYFLARLDKMDDSTGPLIEDEELPAKQRFPKPRLPPNGKISSPRKRPPREQQMLARKRKRAEIEAERQREREQEESAAAHAGPNGLLGTEIDGDDAESVRRTKLPRLDEASNAHTIASSLATKPNNETHANVSGTTSGNVSLLPSGNLVLPPQSSSSSGQNSAGDPEKTGKGDFGKEKDKANGEKEDDKEESNGVLSPSVPIAAH